MDARADIHGRVRVVAQTEVCDLEQCVPLPDHSRDEPFPIRLNEPAYNIEFTLGETDVTWTLRVDVYPLANENWAVTLTAHPHDANGILWPGTFRVHEIVPRASLLGHAFSVELPLLERATHTYRGRAEVTFREI